MKIPGEIAYCMRRRRGCAGNSQAKRTGIRQNSEKPCSIDIIDRKTAPKRQSLSRENLSGHYEGRAEDCAPFFITYEMLHRGEIFFAWLHFSSKMGPFRLFSESSHNGSPFYTFSWYLFLKECI